MNEVNEKKLREYVEILKLKDDVKQKILSRQELTDEELEYIHKIFYKLSMKIHPDKSKGEYEEFQLLNEAHEYLYKKNKVKKVSEYSEEDLKEIEQKAEKIVDDIINIREKGIDNIALRTEFKVFIEEVSKLVNTFYNIFKTKETIDEKVKSYTEFCEVYQEKIEDLKKNIIIALNNIILDDNSDEFVGNMEDIKEIYKLLSVLNSDLEFNYFYNKNIFEGGYKELSLQNQEVKINEVYLKCKVFRSQLSKEYEKIKTDYNFYYQKYKMWFDSYYETISTNMDRLISKLGNIDKEIENKESCDEEFKLIYEFISRKENMINFLYETMVKKYAKEINFDEELGKIIKEKFDNAKYSESYFSEMMELVASDSYKNLILFNDHRIDIYDKWLIKIIDDNFNFEEKTIALAKLDALKDKYMDDYINDNLDKSREFTEIVKEVANEIRANIEKPWFFYDKVIDSTDKVEYVKFVKEGKSDKNNIVLNNTCEKFENFFVEDTDTEERKSKINFVNELITVNKEMSEESKNNIEILEKYFDENEMINIYADGFNICSSSSEQKSINLVGALINSKNIIIENNENFERSKYLNIDKVLINFDCELEIFKDASGRFNVTIYKNKKIIDTVNASTLLECISSLEKTILNYQSMVNYSKRINDNIEKRTM